MLKYSIIVPVYNARKYLIDCVNSVLGQSYTKLELILIDDSSTDGSFEIMQKLGQTDERIRIKRTTHVGQGAARNIGIKMSEGDYILFLDSDDYWDKGYLKKLTDIIELHKADIYLGNQHNDLLGNRVTHITYYSSEDFNKIREKDDKIAFLFKEGNRYPGATWNNVYERYFITANNIEFKDYRMSQDTDFMFAAIDAASKITAHNIDYYFYRKDNGQSVTNTISYSKIIHRLDVLGKWYYYYLKNADRNIQLLTISNRLAIEYFDTFLLVKGINKREGKKEFLRKVSEDKEIWEKVKGKKRKAVVLIMKLFGISAGIVILNKYNEIRMKI